LPDRPAGVVVLPWGRAPATFRPATAGSSSAEPCARPPRWSSGRWPSSRSGAAGRAGAAV